MAIRGLTDYTEVFRQAVTDEDAPAVDQEPKLFVYELQRGQGILRCRWIKVTNCDKSLVKISRV